jgi:hypothetical protein
MNQVRKPPVATWRTSWYVAGAANNFQSFMPLSATATNPSYCFFLPVSSYGFNGNGIGMIDSMWYMSFILSNNTIYAVGSNQLRTLGGATPTDFTILSAIGFGNFTKIVAAPYEIFALSANGRLFHRGNIRWYSSSSLYDLDFKSFGNSSYRFNDVAVNNDGVFALSGTDLYVAGYNGNGSLGVGTFGVSRTLWVPPWYQITGKWSAIRVNNSNTFAYLLSANTNPKQWHVAGTNSYNMGGAPLAYVGERAPYYNFAQPGNGGIITQFIPITGNWDDVTLGQSNAYALSGNQLYAIGLNNNGQLGVGFTGSWNGTISTSASYMRVPVTCDTLPRQQGISFSVMLSGNKLYGAGNADARLLNCGVATNYISFTELNPGSVWDSAFCSENNLFALSSFITPSEQAQVKAPGAPAITSVTNDAVNNYINIGFTAGNNYGVSIANYQYSLNDGLSWTAISPPDNLTPVTITNVTDGANYAIRLQAVNTYGGVSEGSNTILFTFIPNNTLATNNGPSIITDDGRFILVA